ncbi:MAG TPA: hypothetical protein VKS60_24640 [Stellaceae bacterium]|nr:hypothetical protein [Stellaceae bacterium]
MNNAARVPWRRRMSELSRGVGKPHPPLFAPVLWSVACQVEAMEPAAFTADPTKLTRGLVELARALQLEAVVTACPAGMEAEALGAAVDRNSWPPRAIAGTGRKLLDTEDFETIGTRSPALNAAIEATRRIAARERDETVILVALTGPAALQAELAAPSDEPVAYETIARALAALTRGFAEAGANAILLCERMLPADDEGWTGAMRTIANIAKFHRIPTLLSFGDRSSPEIWPGFVIPCPASGSALPQARPCGVAIDPDPGRWSQAMADAGDARIAVTSAEVSPAVSIGMLQEAIAAVRLNRGKAE